MKTNNVTHEIISAAMAVHSELGPGLLENAYCACLRHELSQRGMSYEAEAPIPILYRGLSLDVGYRVDLLVENLVVAELKAVAKLTRIHEAQLLSYLKLNDRRVGLLINFQVLHLRQGIKRMVNRFVPEKL